MVMILDAPPAYEIQVVDVEYQRQGDRALLGTLYRPLGTGPFAAVLEVHGGAWTSKDRFNNADTATTLAKAGIVVLSIDFRMPPEAPYPASLQDINLGIRWLKAHAREYGSAPERVGAYGTSSGGHQVLLAALRPNDARYRALPLASAPTIDAKLAFVVSGWGVLDPLDRYRLAQKLGKAELVKNHDAFWGSGAAHEDHDPRRLFRHGAHAGVLCQAGGPRRHDLERPRPGCRQAGRAAARHRGPGADPRAHPDPQGAARAPAQAPADQPAQRLSAHRRFRLHAARHRRVVEPASGHAILRHRRADLGSGDRGGAPDPAADSIAAA